MSKEDIFIDNETPFQYHQNAMTTPHMPENLPLTHLDMSLHVKELGVANRELARYDGIIETLPNPDLLLSPFMAQEAVLSSRIEGTQASLDEVYEKDAGITFGDARQEDIQEINNYRKALSHAAWSLQDRPLTLMLLREIHEILLNGVRGSSRTPGYFRTIQNWIGTKNSTLETATYIPPSPAYVDMLMENWLRYVVDYEDVDPLIQSAVMHAQLEMIHPFLDGNGRMGRLLIPLFLYKRGVIHLPIFYMSAYLESNREEYCNNLNRITGEGDWASWIRFFLNGVAQQARENTTRARATLKLYDELKTEIREATHSEYTMLVLDMLFRMPTYSIPHMINRIRDNAPDCNITTLRNILKRIADADIVECYRKGAGRRPDIYRLSRLMDIVQG